MIAIYRNTTAGRLIGSRFSLEQTMGSSFMHTRYEWLDALSAKSSAIKSLDVKNAVSDVVYKAGGQKAS
jgi:hypothetical protein